MEIQKKFLYLRMQKLILKSIWEYKSSCRKIIFDVADCQTRYREIQKSSRSGWRIARLRYFNPVGAHQSGLIGESPIGTPNNLFPMISDVAIGKRDNLEIFW